jgi:flagellin-like protein
MKRKKNLKGVSPVIATVLLIAMVVVIALIVFLWFRGLTEESITKFGGTNVKIICGDIQFDASYLGGVLSLQNTGNVPIYGIKAKLSGQGSHETIDIKDFENIDWPKVGLPQGGVFSGDISDEVSDGSIDDVVLIPVLRGKADKGEKLYVCEEQYGKEILIT